MKFLVLLAVVFVALWWVRGGARRAVRAPSAPRPSADATPGSEPIEPINGLITEPMVSCAHCGVYLPQREALSGAGRAYCSPAHRRLAHVEPEGGAR